MKVPKKIKNLLEQRERTCQKYLRIEYKISDWLIAKNVFAKINSSESASFFNTGAGAFEDGSAEISIGYLEELEE